MKISTILALTAFWISQVSCFNFGDCFLEFPDETAQTEILEIVAATDFSNVRVVRKTKLDRGDSFIPFDGDLYNFNFSINGEYSTFFSYENPSGNKVLRYGPYFDDFSRDLGPIKTIDGSISPDGKSYSFIDLSSITFSLSHLNGADSYISNYDLIVNDLFESKSDTIVVGYEPFFTDSMSTQAIFLDDLQYDSEGNAIVISATLQSDVEWTKVLWSSAYYDIPKRVLNPSLIAINSFNEIDTLYNIPTSTDTLSGSIIFHFQSQYDFYYKVTPHGIFIKRGDVIYRLNESEKKLSEPLYEGNLPKQISPNGKFALTRNKLINLETKDVFDPEQTFGNYYQGFVSDSKIIFTGSDLQSIAIFNLETFEMESEISITDLPKFNNLELAEYTREYVTAPLINQNDEVVFMRVRHAYLKDPNYDCYD
ncbi:MAG: hypothetical protein JJ966_00675 [Balneolaceae bacterium]|nr:hypothetical protein [Balneolaceae bacterium]